MTTRTSSSRRLLPLAPLLLVLALLVGACSGGVGSSGADDASGGDVSGGEAFPAAAEDEKAAEAGREALVDGMDDAYDADGTVGRAPQGVARPPVQERAIISVGTVTLASQDVGQARFDVMKVVDGHRGEVTDEQTATDDEGEVQRSRMVIRIPAEAFDEAMDELEEVAILRSAKRNSEDVTTQVIDTAVRVRAQEQSLERVEVLLARARSIRDIVAIEAQLTRRQSELDSLKAQQAYLADQTTMSTITVFLEKKVEPKPAPKPQEDERGFLAGLQDGWHAMTTLGTGAATAAGAFLPFAVLLLLLGVPVWLVARTAVRRRAGDVPTPAEA